MATPKELPTCHSLVLADMSRANRRRRKRFQPTKEPVAELEWLERGVELLAKTAWDSAGTIIGGIAKLASSCLTRQNKTDGRKCK